MYHKYLIPLMSDSWPHGSTPPYPQDHLHRFQHHLNRCHPVCALPSYGSYLKERQILQVQEINKYMTTKCHEKKWWDGLLSNSKEKNVKVKKRKKRRRKQKKHC